MTYGPDGLQTIHGAQWAFLFIIFSRPNTTVHPTDKQPKTSIVGYLWQVIVSLQMHVDGHEQWSHVKIITSCVYKSRWNIILESHCFWKDIYFKSIQKQIKWEK